jgi:hypothetical protein
LLDTPWALAALPGLVLPDTRGERPADLGPRLGFSAALTRLAAEDAAVHAPRCACSTCSSPAARWHNPRCASACSD